MFLKSPDYKYVPYGIRKEENVITFAINNSRRTATPNLRAFYLCTIVKVSCYFCTIKNYKSSSAPSKFFFFLSIPFRPLSSLTVSTIQWDHVVSGQDSYLPPLAPPMAPPTPLSVPGAHTSNSLGITSSCLHLPWLPTHQPFPAILRVAGPRGGFGRLRG